jgi:WXG100 family type VII secretion target
MSSIIQADYDCLAQLSQRSCNESQRLDEYVRRVQSVLEQLAAGGWTGRGADAFFDEMESDVLPALNRLIGAVENTGYAIDQIARQLRLAEEDAARAIHHDDMLVSANRLVSDRAIGSQVITNPSLIPALNGIARGAGFSGGVAFVAPGEQASVIPINLPYPRPKGTGPVSATPIEIPDGRAKGPVSATPIEIPGGRAGGPVSATPIEIPGKGQIGLTDVIIHGTGGVDTDFKAVADHVVGSIYAKGGGSDLGGLGTSIGAALNESTGSGSAVSGSVVGMLSAADGPDAEHFHTLADHVAKATGATSAASIAPLTVADPGKAASIAMQRLTDMGRIQDAVVSGVAEVTGLDPGTLATSLRKVNT